MVVILKEHGIDDITIGEGMVIDPKDNETPAAAFESLGYNALIKKYGVKCVNIHNRPFQSVDLGLKGARILGHQPSQVPHLPLAAQDKGRLVDFSDVQVIGEEIDKTAIPHEFASPFDQENQLPAALANLGVKGITASNIDLTICTYCASPYPALLNFLAMSWTGEQWDM